MPLFGILIFYMKSDIFNYFDNYPTYTRYDPNKTPLLELLVTTTDEADTVPFTSNG